MKLREVFEMLPEFDEDKCVLISEKFAIHFAAWINYNYIAEDGVWIDRKKLKKVSTKDIMNVFKEEYYN